VAQDLPTQTITELRINVAVLSKPYMTIRSKTWVTDQAEKAATWSCVQKSQYLNNVKTAKGSVRAKLNGQWVNCCHIPPSWSINDYP